MDQNTSSFAVDRDRIAYNAYDLRGVSALLTAVDGSTLFSIDRQSVVAVQRLLEELYCLPRLLPCSRPFGTYKT